ncbi:NADP-dependent oxidoreductase [Quadrisphaera sp. INWT6]|uniref:NADP-dependent oxidoreductase n=1 Tax=Quadrisphaera sp. INWT6 TaxID=2596917 RepID=UPI001892135F|nr:NADP-dependent oxidoreductase [Quadrisphaera sp. INWT6]MBF5082839.1 NADP-dependent oxidoreductase [Quadrisphaera sp. INWT6]
MTAQSAPAAQTARSRQWQLVSRPQAEPQPSDVRLVEVELPELAPGQVRVANEFVSVDPYMRGRMDDVKSYVPPFGLGEAMTGGAVGRVVASTAEELPVGTLVTHALGWRDVAQGDASGFRAVPEVSGPSGEAVSSSVHLGILGLTGQTAYVGLTSVAHLQPGEVVFVSGAAGAVGSAVGQVARLLGASRVVGSAGGPEKTARLRERSGFDAALDYKAAPVREQLPALVPDGVDVYFDNVGGDHLEAALDVMNRGGRLALCGAISGYNADRSAPRTPGPDNLANAITRGLTLQGFTLGSYAAQLPEATARLAEWFAAGELVHEETVVDGVERTFEAFSSMMRGGNTGKMVVRVG